MRIAAFLLTLVALARGFAAEPPAIVFVAGEFEYQSKETLPAFAKHLEQSYMVRTTVLERPDDEKVQRIPGLEALESADLVFLAIRRMTLPEEELKLFRARFDSGKPLVAIRTSSHAFQNWLEFDRVVLGGNYKGHHGNKLKPAITILPDARQHPILRNFSEFVSDGSLYRTVPLDPAAEPLLMGKVDGHPPEPVAWTHQYNGGRVFYTSLGHPDDFELESFRTLLVNAIEWSLGQPLQKREPKQ